MNLLTTIMLFCGQLHQLEFDTHSYGGRPRTTVSAKERAECAVRIQTCYGDPINYNKRLNECMAKELERVK